MDFLKIMVILSCYIETGTALGVKGVSNNVALLNLKRFSLAAVGDESLSCGESRVARRQGRGMLSLAYSRGEFTERGWMMLSQLFVCRTKKVYTKLERRESYNVLCMSMKGLKSILGEQKWLLQRSKHVLVF